MAERKPLPGDRPLCKCHGERMNKSGRGEWRCRKKQQAANRAYYEANREKELVRKRDYARAYHWANREEVLRRSRAYYEANREKIAEYRSRPDVKLRSTLYEMTRIRTRY